MYDLIIIGGGPAAVGASVYAARKQLKTLIIAKEFGGQSITSDKIENWIGEIHISGFELAEKMEQHLRAQSSIDIKTGELAILAEADDCTNDKQGCNFTVKTENGTSYRGKSIVIASGARRRRLGIPGEDKFEGKGVAFCSTCDAPLYAQKDVVVVGGGNAGLESVVDLFPYANKIYLVVRGDILKGDAITQKKVKNNPSVTILYNTILKEITGEQFVTGAVCIDNKKNTESMLDVQGIFVEIGSVPNSEIVKNLVEINKFGEIVVDHRTSSTSHPGIFAAGDVTDELYKQNNISVGDGITAALSAYNYLLQHQKETPAAG